MTEVVKSPHTTQQQNTNNIAEFKKGKIVFKQKPLPLESLSETMQEIVKFRDHVKNQDSPLSTVPQDYLPLIAKLVQESDKSLTILAKSLVSLLFPTNSSSPALSDTSVVIKAVEEAIKNVAERVNYGIISEQEKLPSSCTVWRWEIKDFRWLPESVQETALTRLAERKQAREVLQSCFDNFSEQEKNTLLGKKNVQEVSATKREKPEGKSSKAIKEKREAEFTKKSAAAFANYFLKAKVVPQSGRSEASSSTKALNDFESSFKPFLVKKGVRMSPSNWFKADQRSRDCEVVEVVDELIEVWKNNGKNVGRNRISGPLSSYFPPDIPSLHPSGKALSARRQFRKEYQHSVQSIVTRLNEAELQGDQNGVRKLLAMLKNRRTVPAKVLVFAENNRPGYLGTWTKTSTKIGPRTPFALDSQAFDYDYDSDAEWEVDESGEDVDSEEGSTEDDASSTASDIDQWLVDSDDVTEDPAKPLNLNGDKKRKAANVDEDESQNKKRKVVPLVPFQKGPIWEKHLGVCEYVLFDQMRIQMFNDSPIPLNPFEYVSKTTAEKIDTQTNGITSRQTTDTSRMANNKQNTAQIPKTSFPDTHIEALLRKATTVNTSSFAVFVDIVYQDLKSLGVKKNALEFKLREVLEKDKETKHWRVKETAWIQYGMTKP